jgi:hypothetical protein
MLDNQRKCFNCRTPITGTAIKCKDCEGKPVKTTSTYIIFDKL